MAIMFSLLPLIALAPHFEYPEGLVIVQNNTLSSPKIPQIVNSLTLGSLFIAEDIDYLIDQLSVCESGNNQSAINPVDKDGTASNGLFQFKRTTWKHYIIKYNLFSWQVFEEEDFENALWDGNAQRVVVEKMFKDPQVNLRLEFPDCSKSLNLEKNYGN